MSIKLSDDLIPRERMKAPVRQSAQQCGREYLTGNIHIIGKTLLNSGAPKLDSRSTGHYVASDIRMLGELSHGPLMNNVTSSTFYRIMRYNISGIRDYEVFPYRKLTASRSPIQFARSAPTSRTLQRVSDRIRPGVPFDRLLEVNNSVAFVIVKDDAILYEKYFQGYAESSISMSFSMAKSFLSMLVGCAVEDGYIESVEQPVSVFVPELERNGYGMVRISHLLQMTSGMDYVENDNPFGIHVRFYYTMHLEQEIIKLGLKEKPGTRFVYKSGETALLGLILKRALNGKSITEYMQERIWEPIGTEFDGRWSIDNESNGLEKTWCCFSASARDFAKLGNLYLHGGNWNGKQLIPRQWIADSTRLDTDEGSVWNYQYQWWLASIQDGDYMAVGHLGQYLYIYPRNRVVIIRLGKGHGKLGSEGWTILMRTLAQEIS